MSFLCSPISHSFLLATFLLASHVAAETHPRTLEHVIPVNNFLRSCAFELGGYTYNLCPLARETVSTSEIRTSFISEDDRGEGSSSGKRTFSINIRGEGAERDQQRKLLDHETSECGDETWVCLTETTVFGGRKTVNNIPLVRRVVDLGEASKITVTLEDKGIRALPTLQFFTHVSERDGRSLSCDIILLCSVTQVLQYRTEDQGVYSLSWASPHACPVLRSAVVEQAEDEVPSEEEKQGDDDLVGKQGMSTFRKLMVVALLVLVIPLVGGTVLLSSMRARNFALEKVHGVASTIIPFISTAAVKLRPIGRKLQSPFRQSSNKLVRWAQEDMSLADSAEDVMVNGSGAFSFDDDGWNADGLEEYIPLSANPRHGRNRQVRSYGTTPTVETFAERQEGWLSKFGGYFRR